MKNTFFNYIKITLALVLFLQVGKVSAQSFVNWGSATSAATLSGTFTGGTATVTQSATGSANKLTSPGQATLTSPGLTQAGKNFVRINGGLLSEVPADAIITFNTPVKITKLNITGLDAPASYNDQLEFSGVSFSGFTGSPTATVTSTGVKPMLGITNDYGSFTNSTSAVSSFTIKSIPRNGLYAAAFFVEMEVIACKAGTTAPVPTGTTLTATNCPTNTVSLTSLEPASKPAGTTVKWYSDATHTTEVTTPTAVGNSGTYYAFFYDAAADCYSPASAAVTVTANCPLNLPTSCPDNPSIDLSSHITTTPATGYTYTYHTGTPATAANKITNPVVTTAGTYYIGTYFAAQDCYATTSRPIVVTITNCCATVAPPTVN